MTRTEHDRQRSDVRASLLLADTRAQRHGVYVRRPKVLPPVPATPLPRPAS